MICRSYILIIAVILSFPQAAAPRGVGSVEDSTFYTIAVSDFSLLGDIKELQWIGESCAEGVASELITEPAFRIVERKFLNTVINELKFQESGLVDEQHAVTLGKLTGARYFILGSATVVQQSILLRARLINVETAEAIISCEANGTVDQLFVLQTEIARKIVLRLLGRSIVSNDHASVEPSSLTNTTQSTLHRLKKMATVFPLFSLDPARKRKTAEFTMAGILCDNIIEQNPNAVPGYYYKALFNLHAEEYTVAETAIRTALRITPGDNEVLLLRAMLLFHTEQYADARTLLRYLVSRVPRDARVWYGAAKTAARLNDHPFVVDALINTLQATPFISQAETFLDSELSQRQFSQNDFADSKTWKALVLYKKMKGNNDAIGAADLPLTVAVAQAFPDLYVPYFVAGKIYASLGKRMESEDSFRRCLARAPALPFIHRELAYLYLQNGNCDAGKKHAALYIQTSQAIEDYQQLHHMMDRCR